MTAATLTLTDFLLARIAEDEAIARKVRQHEAVDDRDYMPLLATEAFGMDLVGASSARVLAECEAKRRIVLRHVSFDGRCGGCGQETVAPFLDGLLVTTCPELRYLAAVYADHDDYREAWRP